MPNVTIQTLHLRGG